MRQEVSRVSRVSRLCLFSLKRESIRAKFADVPYHLRLPQLPISHAFRLSGSEASVSQAYEYALRNGPFDSRHLAFHCNQQLFFDLGTIISHQYSLECLTCLLL